MKISPIIWIIVKRFLKVFIAGGVAAIISAFTSNPLELIPDLAPMWIPLISAVLLMIQKLFAELKKNQM